MVLELDENGDSITDENGENGVSFCVVFSVPSDDVGENFLSVAPYKSAMSTAEASGLSLTAYECTLMRNGMTAAVYTTTNAADYIAVVDDETASLTAEG